jgi:hypothetical protein
MLRATNSGRLLLFKSATAMPPPGLVFRYAQEQRPAVRRARAAMTAGGARSSLQWIAGRRRVATRWQSKGGAPDKGERVLVTPLLPPETAFAEIAGEKCGRECR